MNNNSVACTLSNVNPEIDTITKIRDNFPTELQQVDQWVLWRYTMRGDKLTKVPFQTSGNEAKSNDPTTWASFADACHAYQNGNFDGLGFMFSEHDPYIGIDFDKCISDDGMDSQRREWIKSLDSYTEYSPSGKGVHIFIRGALPESGRKSNKLNVEMYEQTRFFTVTGDHVEGTPSTVNSRQKQLKAFHAEIFPTKEPSKPNSQPMVSYEGIPADDRELLDRMFNAANGHKIEALYKGDTGAYDGDKSAADIALCSHLAFWTGKDVSRIDSLFRQSGLMRDKWDSKRPGGTYGTMTIDEAIKGATETYSGKRSADKPVDALDADEVDTADEDDATAETAGSDDQPRKGKKSDNKPTQIYKLALKHCDLFTGTDGIVYASADVNGHTEIIKVRSMRFRQYLGNLFFQKKKAVAGKSACDEAIELLSFQGDSIRSTFMRVAGHNDDIYIDLGNDKWQAIRISAKGWEVTDKAPVAFRRTAKMRPLPIPVSSGTDQSAAINDLFSLINVAFEDRTLVLAWLLSAMCPKGPYPILTLVAEAGSAKTTTAKALKRLISPYVAETRSRPKTVEDVYVAAQNDWVLIYDNLSSIPVDISDAFCRLSTGGGYATRELYADLDEVATDQQQPLIINGISDIIKKGDLMSRALVVTCPEITQEKRVAESDWDARFEEARPRIMGALLDLLSAVLEELPNVKLDTLPRMADFAKLGAALDKVCKIAGNPLSFMTRYSDSIAHGTMSVIEQSQVYRPLYRFMKHHGKEWTGTATALLEEIRKHATDLERIDMPTLNTKLSNAISEIAPNLRLANIMDVRKNKSNGSRSITIVPMKDFAKGEPETTGTVEAKTGTVQGR